MLSCNSKSFFVHFRWSNKSTAASQDWVAIHMQHITRWQEQAMAMVKVHLRPLVGFGVDDNRN